MTLDSFNSFTITVTPQSILWKYRYQESAINLIIYFQMNDAEQASTVVFVSLDGLVMSVINSAYQEVALLSVSSVPAVWEVEVNNRWKILNVELQTWLEDQWRNKQGQTNLQEQFEVYNQPLQKTLIGGQ